ncbi:MAG: xanthine dehydrogenase family protein molybdopterin-binding subunit [Geminicoccaceae bacterium]
MLQDRFSEVRQDKVGAARLSRRHLLRVGAAVGGGLLLEVGLPGVGRTEAAATGDGFAPNAFVRIGRDGGVTVTMPQVEMGQGIYTAQAMLVAEELDVDLGRVSVEHAPADDALFSNPLIGFQVTGGSTSVRAFFTPLRQAGATARAMLVAAAAKEWQVDPASCTTENGAVVHAPSGRRAEYGALADAAATLPVPQEVALKEPGQRRLIGTAAKRLDVAGKVNGSAVFGIDVRLPGMKVATVAACPVFGGKLRAVDDGKALAVRGVRQVIRLEDAVAVVADHMGAARKGLDALVIDWDEGENAKLTTADLVAQLEEGAGRLGVVAKEAGDAAATLEGAARRLEADYHMPLLAHAPMEPMNCTVHVRPDGCEVWTGSQVVARAKATAIAVTGLPPDKVVVHNQYLGGGFGRRLEVDYVTQAVRIGQQVDGPVKVVWTREEDIQHDIFRPIYLDRLSAGLDAAGHPVSFRHRVVSSSIIARWVPEYFKDGLDFDAVDGAAGPYDFANLLVDWVRVDTPTGLATGWWRGVGVTHNAFVVEGFIDELAAAAGKDPVDHRRALLEKAPRARAVLDLAAEKAGWGEKLPAGKGRGVALVLGFDTYIAQVAEVAVAGDGSVRVERVVCAVDCGTVVNPDTVAAQMQGGIMYGLTAALHGEITLKDGRVEQANFDTYPILRIDEAPKVEVHIVPSEEAPGGIGEPGTATIAPAVVNAVFAATGKRLRKLPIDPAELRSST